MGINYDNAFIAISADCKAGRGTAPARVGSVAALQYEMLHSNPYRYTSEDVLFLVHAKRHGIAEADYPRARAEFFSTPKACLRCSPLVKNFGWGIHHDAGSRVAIYGVETPRYAELSEDTALAQVAGMRNARK